MYNNILNYIVTGILIVTTLSLACNNIEQKKQGETRKEKQAKTNINFTENEYDFGTITGGEYVTHRFEFKNTGTNDLYISKVLADCGCTIADYKKEPVKPGEKGFIELVFNSEGYHGLQIKKVNVYANTIPAVYELTIAATVK